MLDNLPTDLIAASSHSLSVMKTSIISLLPVGLSSWFDHRTAWWQEHWPQGSIYYNCFLYGKIWQLWRHIRTQFSLVRPVHKSLPVSADSGWGWRSSRSSHKYYHSMKASIWELLLLQFPSFNIGVNQVRVRRSWSIIPSMSFSFTSVVFHTTEGWSYPTRSTVVTGNYRWFPVRPSFDQRHIVGHW